MSESDRDSGLVRTVGTWGLAASTVNTVVGAGIFAVPSALAASVGTYAPLAFLVCAVAIGAVAICFAEGGSRVPTSGGAYGYVEAAFGPLAGYVAGTLLWFSDALACGSIAAALADVTVTLLPASPPSVRAVAHAGVIVSVIGGMALVNLGGVARGMRVIHAATLVKLVPLAIFILAGAAALHGAGVAAGPAHAAGDSSGVGRALILALFSFTGMEGSLGVSGEVTQPARTIPRALGLSMFAVTLLYVAIQIIAQGILGSSLPQSTVPLGDAMAHIHPSLRGLMLGGAALSMFGWIGSDVLSTPRIVFALARDGMLPRALGRVHPRTRVPHVAILAYAGLAIGLALTGTFAELAVLSTLAVAPLYMGGSAAAWRLARRGVARAGEPLAFRWLGAATIVGVGGMAIMIALASRAEILGLVAMLGGSVLLYVVQTRIKQRRGGEVVPR